MSIQVKRPGAKPAIAPAVTKLEQFLTIAEVAMRWKMSKRHIQRLIERGELGACRFGRAVRISLTNVRLYEMGRADGM